MNDRFDKLFKLALLVILAGFLYVYAASQGVGRYQYSRDGELDFLLDTKTGLVYQGGYIMNHLTGKEGPSKK